MKITIWGKDDYLRLIGTARIDMDAEAVVLPTEAVPLTMDFDHQKPPIGKVSDIRLEDGEIVGDVTWFEHSEITDEVWEDWYEEYYRFAGYYRVSDPPMVGWHSTDFESELPHRISASELKCVSVVAKAAVPGGE